MLSIWKTVGKKTLRAWVGSKFLKSYERGFEDGKKVDARDKQVMYKEAYRYGLAEGKAALANAYNSGYRDADLDRREKNDSLSCKIILYLHLLYGLFGRILCG